MKHCLLALTLLIAGLAHASGYLESTSPHDVDTTMQRLQQAAENKGLQIFSLVDHAAGAHSAGMDLAPNKVLIFGNPKLGTLLMKQNPAIGVDLPLKISVWQDAQGHTRVTYRDIQSLAGAHGLERQLKPVQQARGVLAGLVQQAIAAD